MLFRVGGFTTDFFFTFILMKNSIWLILLSFLLAFSPLGASCVNFDLSETSAFDPDTRYRVELYNGRVYTGKILEDDGVKIKLESENVGLIIIQKSEIKQIKELTEEDSDYVASNPMVQSKLPQMNLLSQSAFTPDKGTLNLYISLIHLNAEFSVTNTTVIGFETGFFAAYGFNVKQSYQFSESFRGAVKMKFGGVLGRSLTELNAGIGQASFTFGHDANNFTVNGGLLYYTDYDIYTEPYLGIAFQTEVTASASLLGEAMYMPGNSAFIGMIGFRKETEPGFGLFTNYDNNRVQERTKVFWDFGGGLLGFDGNFNNPYQPDFEIYPGIMIRYSRTWN